MCTSFAISIGITLFTSHSSSNTITTSSNEINHYFYHSDRFWTQNFVDGQCGVESHVCHDVHDGHQGAGDGDSTGQVPDRVLELLYNEVEIIPANKNKTRFSLFLRNSVCWRYKCCCVWWYWHHTGEPISSLNIHYLKINIKHKNLTSQILNVF